VRDDHPALEELAERGMTVTTSRTLQRQGSAAVTARALDRLREQGLDRFWIHLDVDVVDPAHVAAVDSPTPGGPSLGELAELVAGRVEASEAVGMQVTVFDPDLDPSGEQAARLAEALVAGLAGAGRAAAG
jgi:arginase